MKIRWVLFPLLLASAILVSGCNAEGGRSQPLDSVWARGLNVGTANLREPAAITVTDQGRKAHLIWAQKGDYGTDIHFTLVDREAGVQVSENLQSGLFLPRTYRLFVTPRGQIHLLTLAKSNKDGVSGVYHLLISEQGELVAGPELVSPPDQSVESYDAALLPDGQASLVWESSRESGGGLYQRTIDLASGARGDIVMVNARGEGPSLAWDETGVLHLVWHVDDGVRGVRDIFYTGFPHAVVEASDGFLLTTHGRSDSASYSQPVVGYDDGHVYVFWHSEIVAGMEAGTGKTLFLAFPKGRPESVAPREILIPDLPGGGAPTRADELWYTPISANMVMVSSSYVIYPSPISSTASELSLLLSAKTTYRMQEAMQPVMAVLEDGVQIGYAPVARTDHLSYFPVGVRDSQENGYSVWLDYRGGGRYPVYLSATSPEWKAGALQMTGRAITTDVSRELAFGLLAVVALIPMSLLILLLPLAWIVILLLLGRAAHLDTRSGRIELGVAIAIFYVTKIAAFLYLLSSPSLLRTMPQAWASVLLFAIPVSIFVIAVIPLLIYVRRADPPGLPTGFFLFAITDLLLTMLVYGPTLYS